MARRKVTHSAEGRGQVIAGLCGPSFGFLLAEDVISDIQGGKHQYYVREAPYESSLRVVEKGGMLQLVSTEDVFSRNNLFNLPHC